MTNMPVGGIKIPATRHRQDLGDLASLIESIRTLGLLHPIVVTPDGTLVAGHRRFVACQSIGMTEVPVRVVAKLSDALLQLQAERDENVCRLSMKPSELVSLGLELEKLEKPKAAARTGGRPPKTDGNFPSVSPSGPSEGPTRDIVGEALGWSGRTYGEAKKVILATADPDPKVRRIAEKAAQEMDSSGKVSPAYRKVAEAQNPALAPKHPEPIKARIAAVPELDGKKPMAGSRSVRSGISSLKQAALDIESVASAFDADAFGDLSVLVSYNEAGEWLDLLADAALRLNAHLRTVKRYRQSRKEASA